MAAFRSERTLPVAARSVLDQSYGNLVLGIAVPSRDAATLSAARELADNRVIVIEQTGKGIADARNLVLHGIDADLYMLLDADDVMKRGTVEAFVRHRRETAQHGLRFGHYTEKLVDDPRSERTKRSPFLGLVPCAFERLSLLNFIGSGAIMIDREVVDEVGCFDTRFHHAEDWHYWLRIARAYPLWGLDVTAYQYSYGKLTIEQPKSRAFFDDGARVINDVDPPWAIKALSLICINAMYALYYLRTLRSRKTLKQLLDIRITDILCLPPAAVIRILRGHGIV